jgi:hypothetical protein
MSDNSFNVIKRALDQIESAVTQIRQLTVDKGAVPDHITIGSSTSDSEPPLRSDVAIPLPSPRKLAQHQLSSETPLTGAEQTILAAIASLERARPLQMHLTLVAALAGYQPSEKSFLAALERLRARSLISLTAHAAKLTIDGERIAIPKHIALNSDVLAERIAIQLTKPQSRIFRFLFEMRGTAVHRDEIAQKCNIPGNHKSLQKAISSLQSLALIERTSGNHYSCAEMVFIDS